MWARPLRCAAAVTALSPAPELGHGHLWVRPLCRHLPHSCGSGTYVRGSAAGWLPLGVLRETWETLPFVCSSPRPLARPVGGPTFPGPGTAHALSSLQLRLRQVLAELVFEHAGSLRVTRTEP